MKKLISLLLVLVLTVGMLAGISFAAEMPVETTQADAGICVTFAGSDEKFYFETLTQEVIAWAAKELPGAPTFTLLKDLTLSNPGETGATFLTIPSSNDEWHTGAQPIKSGKLPVTVDLNGKTMSYSGASNLFRATRWGMTLKNGTVVYSNNANKSRGIITLGGSDSAVANSGATSVYAPEIVFDNVKCINISETNSPILASYLYAPKIVVKDSVLWSFATAAFNLQKSTQSNLGTTKLYEGAFAPTVEISNSVVGSSKHYFLSSVDAPGITVTAKDSVLATGHSTGLLVKKGNPVTLDIAQDLAEQAGWFMDVAGHTLTAKAFLAGQNPGKVELPFTDVKEGDWFFPFVSEMYSRKIINGMTETTFVPGGNLTYGQALKLIVVGLGVDAPEAEGHWASGYLKLAQENGWVTGNVDLDGAVTRLAFCRIAASAKNLVDQPESNPFKDTADTSVLALVKAGVISGMSADTFNPAGVLTRAQIAKIISLLIKL